MSPLIVIHGVQVAADLKPSVHCQVLSAVPDMLPALWSVGGCAHLFAGLLSRWQTGDECTGEQSGDAPDAHDPSKVETLAAFGGSSSMPMSMSWMEDANASSVHSRPLHPVCISPHQAREVLDIHGEEAGFLLQQYMTMVSEVDSRVPSEETNVAQLVCTCLPDISFQVHVSMRK